MKRLAIIIIFSLLFTSSCLAALPVQAKLKWTWPTTAKRISQMFFEGHQGVDIDGEKNDPIFAAAKGEVIERGRHEAYGRYIVIKHNEKLQTKYAHLRKILVKKGEKVKKGQKIGKMGKSGWTTGYHLHFEIFKNGEKVNPLDYKFIRKYLRN